MKIKIKFRVHVHKYTFQFYKYIKFNVMCHEIKFKLCNLKVY